MVSTIKPLCFWEEGGNCGTKISYRKNQTGLFLIVVLTKNEHRRMGRCKRPKMWLSKIYQLRFLVYAAPWRRCCYYVKNTRHVHFIFRTPWRRRDLRVCSFVLLITAALSSVLVPCCAFMHELKFFEREAYLRSGKLDFMMGLGQRPRKQGLKSCTTDYPRCIKRLIRNSKAVPELVEFVKKKKLYKEAYTTQSRNNKMYLCS